MGIKRAFLNLSIKYKILILIYIIITGISLIFGFYSYSTSKKYIINKVSSSNLEVISQISSNIDFMQSDIVDISTYLCLDPVIQTLLNNNLEGDEYNPQNHLYVGNSLKFITNLIASKSYISSILLYGEDDIPKFYEFTDMSSGAGAFSKIANSNFYIESAKLQGAPLWSLIKEGRNILIEDNKNSKIAMTRIIKNTYNFNAIGFLVICVNEATLRSLYYNNIHTDTESIVIVNEQDSIISSAGPTYFDETYLTNKLLPALKNESKIINNYFDKDFLITATSISRSGWKVIYTVPTKTLTNEINTIKNFTFIVITSCILISFPFMLLISSFLTAPMKKLLKSMKRFQNGNFDERVEFKYTDEIGKLGEGFNNMVVNIKELIDKAYISQIKRREAELNALQSQINPHFLYNMLDTIYWKSQKSGELEISEMVYSLSRLFRLSLNRGKEFITISSEKELITHYLILQKMRFKNKLNYKIDISDDIKSYIIPKLILQPFVENSILHGIYHKENGGNIVIYGCLKERHIYFSIEDDGLGMSSEYLEKIYDYSNDFTSDNSTTGGYAIRNIQERLKLIYGESFSLCFVSAVNKGTKVELLIPILENSQQEEISRW